MHTILDLLNIAWYGVYVGIAGAIKPLQDLVYGYVEPLIYELALKA